MKKKIIKRGFAPRFIVIVVILLIGLIGGGFYLWRGYNAEKIAFQNQIQEADAARQKAELEKQEAEKKACKGVWQSGVCVQSTCVDSDVNEKPKDIYIKGNVRYSNESGIGTTVSDECTGSKKQVNEMWCYESPSGSGNYVPGKMVYNCPKGCLDGACIK